MARQTILAQVSVSGETKTGKRVVEVYDSNSEVTAELLADANRGLVLREQASIRQALKAKYGEGRTSAPRDTSAAEEV